MIRDIEEKIKTYKKTRRNSFFSRSRGRGPTLRERGSARSPCT